MILLQFVCYPTIRSIGRDTKFTVFVCMCVRLRISQPGLYILPWNFAWRFGLMSDRSCLFWGDSPRDGRILGVNWRHMAGYAFCTEAHVGCCLLRLIGWWLSTVNGEWKASCRCLISSSFLSFFHTVRFTAATLAVNLRKIVSLRQLPHSLVDREVSEITKWQLIVMNI